MKNECESNSRFRCFGKINMLSVLFIVNGVVTDESVSVIEGDSVTLYTNTNTQRDHLIEWRFEGVLIARINGEADSQRIHDDVLDGRFRDKLKLNTETGDLTITNTHTPHTGNYSVYIKRAGETKTKNFSVYVFGDKVKTVTESPTIILVTTTVSSNKYTVHGLFNVTAQEQEEPPILSPDAIAGICGGGVLLLLAAAVAVVLYKRHARTTGNEREHVDHQINNEEIGIEMENMIMPNGDPSTSDVP